MAQRSVGASWILYGANGFTGAMIAEQSRRFGTLPILAGRDPRTVSAVANRLGLQWRAFKLDNIASVRAGISGARMVLNAAGPFAFTCRPMLEACLEEGVHYLDISGEVETFEDCANADERARQRGIMVLPGVGFDMVPGDCLALHLQQRLPTADRLEIGLRYGGGLSRGTSKSALLTFGQGVLIRNDHQLTMLRHPVRRQFDFGDGPQPTVSITFADVSVSWRTTGIPNITVYALETEELKRLNSLPQPIQKMMGLRPVKALMTRRLNRLPTGPSPGEIAENDTRLVGIATDSDSDSVSARLTMPQIYAITARLAARIADRVASGDWAAGYQTPARQFGSHFITDFAGCSLEDIT